MIKEDIDLLYMCLFILLICMLCGLSFAALLFGLVRLFG